MPRLRRELRAARRDCRPTSDAIAPSGTPARLGRRARRSRQHRVGVRRRSRSRAGRPRCPTSGTARRRRSSRSGAPRRRPRRRRAARGPCGSAGRSGAGCSSSSSPTGSGSAAICARARGHRGDPPLVERQAVEQRVGAGPASRAAVEVERGWLRGSPATPRLERRGDRLQRRVLDRRCRASRACATRAWRARADLLAPILWRSPSAKVSASTK